MKKGNIRVLLGKVGLDGHDRGVRFVASILRDAGMDVIYLGRFLPPEAVVQAALEEDVDVVALSFLSGEYNYYVPQIIDSLKTRVKKDIITVIGGLIFKEDISRLKQAGVDGVFGPGSTGEQIIEFIRKAVVERQAGAGIG